MKKNNLFLFAVIILMSFFFINPLKAGVTLSEFKIQNAFLSGGTKLLVDYSMKTKFTARFKFLRAGNLYNTVKVYLVYREINGAETIISSEPKYRYNGDWLFGDPNIWESTVEGSLAEGNLYKGSVYLIYQVFEGSSQGGTNSSLPTKYDIYVSNAPVTPGGPPTLPPVVTPPDPPYVEGPKAAIKPYDDNQQFSPGTKNIVENGTYHLDYINGDLILYNGTQVLFQTSHRGDRSNWNVIFKLDGNITFQSPGRASETMFFPLVETTDRKRVFWYLGPDGNFAGYNIPSLTERDPTTVPRNIGKKFAETATSGGVVSGNTNGLMNL